LLLHSQSMPLLDGQLSRKQKREFSDTNLRLEKALLMFRLNGSIIYQGKESTLCPNDDLSNQSNCQQSFSDLK